MNPTRARRALTGAGDLLLTLAAIAGAICILAVLAAWIFKITLIMFSTGSMAPTIPTGSVAVVRQIPAAQVKIGDVVTVDRPGRLPVTHRVRAIRAGHGDTRLLTLRGDANAADDAETYPVQSVRRVMFSVPGLARMIVAFSDPFMLGAITITMAALVLWAFWPHDPKPADRSQSRNGRTSGGAAAALIVVVVGVGGALRPSTPATAAAVNEEVIRGSVITLTIVGDQDAMTNLRPGQPVRWQVGVNSDPPDPGTIDLSLLVSGPLARVPGGLQLAVSSCPSRWQAGHCPAGASVVLPAAPAANYSGPVLPAGTLPAGEQRWLQVRAEIPAGTRALPADAGWATVRIGASGFGDSVVTGVQPPALSNTGIGGGVRAALISGFIALLGGMVLMISGRRTRR